MRQGKFLIGGENLMRTNLGEKTNMVPFPS